MHVAFAQAAGGDAGEPGALAQFLEVGCANISHAGLEAAHELENDIGERSLVWDAAFNTLCHQFAGTILAVAVARAFLHGADRAHAAVGLEAAALEMDRLARAFAGAGEQRAEHDEIRPGGERLDDVTGVADAAIGDDFHAIFPADIRDISDGGELRHAHAGNHPGGADGAWPHAHFHRAGTGGNQITRSLFGDYIACDHRHVRERAQLADRFHDDAGVAGGGIDEKGIRAGNQQRLAAVDAIGPHAHGRAAAKASLRVLGGVGEGDAFFNI